MDKVTTDDLLGYWQVSVSVKAMHDPYLLWISGYSERRSWYGDRGVAAYNKGELRLSSWMALSFLDEIDGCAAPIKHKTVWYQIFPRAICQWDQPYLARRRPSLGCFLFPWKILDFSLVVICRGLSITLDYLQDRNYRPYLCPIFESRATTTWHHRLLCKSINILVITPCWWKRLTRVGWRLC